MHAHRHAEDEDRRSWRAFKWSSVKYSGHKGRMAANTDDKQAVVRLDRLQWTQPIDKRTDDMMI